MKMLLPVFLNSFLLNSFAQSVPCPTEPVKLNPGLESTMHFGENLTEEIKKTPPEELDVMATRLKNVKNCPEKIWPDYKLPNTPVRIIEPSRDSVYKYNSEKEKFEWERSVSENDKRVRVFEPNTDGDGGMTVNGLRYIKPLAKEPSGNSSPQKPAGPKVCIEENKAFDSHMKDYMTKSNLQGVDKMLSFTAHESFHTVDQNPSNVVHQHNGACQWNREEFERSLPGDIKDLKLARQHLILNLLEAYKAPKSSSKRNEALAQVKAWSLILETKYPEESKVLFGVDRAEGMAEYAGIMANVYGKLGCSPDQDEKKNLIVTHLESRYMPMVQDPDQQGYLIGAISGLLMDEEGVKNWKEQVTKETKSPHELLKNGNILSSVSPAEAIKDDVLLASVEVESKLNTCKTNEVKKELDPIIKGDEEYVIIQLDRVTFSSTGFHSYTTEDNQSISVSLGSSSEGPTVKMENLPIIRIDGLCPNGGSPNYIAVPKKLVDSQGEIVPQEKYNVKTKVDLADQSVKWNSHQVDCR